LTNREDLITLILCVTAFSSLTLISQIVIKLFTSPANLCEIVNSGDVTFTPATVYQSLS